MDVAVKYDDSLCAPFSLHGAGGDDGIVEQAESLATIPEGVMGAAGQVDGDALSQGGPAGGDGAARGVARPQDQLW